MSESNFTAAQFMWWQAVALPWTGGGPQPFGPIFLQCRVDKAYPLLDGFLRADANTGNDSAPQ
jgi:hypothetical protein